MAEDAGVGQARMLVGLLRDAIAEISDKLKAPDSDVHRRTEHGHHRRVRRAAVIAASVLRGAPTPRRPLSPIPRNPRPAGMGVGIFGIVSVHTRLNYGTCSVRYTPPET
jgi:hypothetical protein